MERAKALLKTINPGIDLNALLSGEKLLIGNGPRIEPEHVEALRTVVTTLSDEDALTAVGLANEGGRIRRKAGTQDELLSPKVVSDLEAFLKSLL